MRTMDVIDLKKTEKEKNTHTNPNGKLKPPKGKKKLFFFR
jgi:hypothetical protein